MTTSNRPLVSVIIPAFNAEKWIVETLTSVTNQTWNPLEVIVIDDGSTDATSELIKTYFPNVLCIRQENAGQASARNRAVTESSGEYLAFLDSDDLWLPEKIESQMRLINKNSDVSLVFCDYESFGKESCLHGFERGPILNTLKSISLSTHGRLIEEEDLLTPLLKDMYCLGPPCWLTTRKFFDLAGGFDPTLKAGGEDWLFAIRLANLGRFSYDIRRLAKRREHPESHSRQSSESIGLAQAMSRIIDEPLGLPDRFISTVRQRLAFSCLYIGQIEAMHHRDPTAWFVSAKYYAKSLPLDDFLKITLRATQGLISKKIKSGPWEDSLGKAPIN